VPALSPAADPRPWRQEVQSTVSRIFALLGAPVGVWTVITSIQQGFIEQAIVIVLVVGLLVWSAWGRGSASLKASLNLGALLAIGLVGLAYTGWSAQTAVLLTAATIFALLTLGPSAAAFSVIVATVGYAVAAYAFARYDWDPLADSTLRLTRLLRLLLLFPGMIGGSVVAVHYIIRRLERTIATLNEVSSALQHSEAQFRELFDNVPDGVFQTSADGRILMANPAYAQMLGFGSPDAMRDLDARDLYEVPGDRDQIVRALERDGESRNVEVRLRRQDGRIVTVLMNARVVRDEHGAVLHYEGTIVDLTDRKQLEDQLLQARKLEAIGRLAGGVAHDFNNLLTAILGFAQLAKEREPGSERQRRDLESIESAAQSASHLTRQLLAFSRKQVLQPKVTDLNSVVTGARTLLGRVIGEDIELIMRLAPDLPPVLVDAGQMEQVILNLGINARDAMPRGGRLTIETYAEAAPGGHVGLAVTDTGVGIDSASMTHIFEPFFTTKEPGRGTGLGLATVYGIVQQSGGLIEVQSELGRGTRFQIHLPRSATPLPAAADVARSTPAAGGAETILLVEDEAEVRQIAREILENAGYTVLEATSGAEALDLFTKSEFPIDLVLTDVIMPSMSGPVLAERFKALATNMPVIFMSGYTDDALARHGMPVTDVPFLAKPFTVHGLLTKIRQVLDAAGAAL
jgi:PAS domain S-box-containing protein